jgi:hypothetical protein
VLDTWIHRKWGAEIPGGAPHYSLSRSINGYKFLPPAISLAGRGKVPVDTVPERDEEDTKVRPGFADSSDCQCTHVRPTKQSASSSHVTFRWDILWTNDSGFRFHCSWLPYGADADVTDEYSSINTQVSWAEDQRICCGPVSIKPESNMGLV